MSTTLTCANGHHASMAGCHTQDCQFTILAPARRSVPSTAPTRPGTVGWLIDELSKHPRDVAVGDYFADRIDSVRLSDAYSQPIVKVAYMRVQ
jgi:hypothetical protein